MGPQFVVAGLDADDPRALGEHAIHADAGHDHGTGLLALLGQPHVQLGPQTVTALTGSASLASL